MYILSIKQTIYWVYFGFPYINTWPFNFDSKIQNKPNKYLAESSSYFLFDEGDFYNMNYIYINILYQNIHRILICSPYIILICTGLGTGLSKTHRGWDFEDDCTEFTTYHVINLYHSLQNHFPLQSIHKSPRCQILTFQFNPYLSI